MLRSQLYAAAALAKIELCMPWYAFSAVLKQLYNKVHNGKLMKILRGGTVLLRIAKCCGACMLLGLRHCD